MFDQLRLSLLDELLLTFHSNQTPFICDLRRGHSKLFRLGRHAYCFVKQLLDYFCFDKRQDMKLNQFDFSVFGSQISPSFEWAVALITVINLIRLEHIGIAALIRVSMR